MSKTNNLSEFLTDVADAIRNKKGTTNPINAQNFSNEIASIESNKPESSVMVTPSETEQTITPENGSVFNEVIVEAIQTEEKTVTENGDVTPTEGKYLSKVSVNVEQPILQEKTVTPTKSIQEVTPDSDYNGLSKVSVGAIPDEYIVPILQEKTVTPTNDMPRVSDITPDEGYDGLSKVTIICPADSNYIAPGSTKIITKNGTHFVLDYEFAKVNVEAGSLSENTGPYLVQVIDYDGTVLKKAKTHAGALFTLPTPPPDTSRLRFQEWSSPVEIVDNTITVSQNITIGAVYKTISDTSEFYITLNSITGLTTVLKMDGLKDWGDGTSDMETSHTYSAYGDYTICCSGTAIQNGTSSTSGPFGDTYAQKQQYRRIFLADGVTIISNYAFANCRSLELISLPSSVNKIKPYAFHICDSLESIVVPKAVTALYGNTFKQCRTLKTIALGQNITSLGSSDFANDYSLTSVSIPSGLTEIRDGAFGQCHSLSSIIVIPSGVTNIGSNAFSSLYKVRTFDFSWVTAIPTLENDMVFYDIDAQAKIVVPDELYDEWIAATNWSTYADYIYKESEVTE